MTNELSVHGLIFAGIAAFIVTIFHFFLVEVLRMFRIGPFAPGEPPDAGLVVRYLQLKSEFLFVFSVPVIVYLPFDSAKLIPALLGLAFLAVLAWRELPRNAELVLLVLTRARGAVVVPGRRDAERGSAATPADRPIPAGDPEGATAPADE